MTVIIYTTKLDKDSHNYAERSRMAQRIASEIEGKASSSIFLCLIFIILDYFVHYSHLFAIYFH